MIVASAKAIARHTAQGWWGGTSGREVDARAHAEMLNGIKGQL